MKHIAIFASGEGTNAEQIINYFKNSKAARVSLVVTNNPHANVINRAKAARIPCVIIDKKQIKETTVLLDELKKHKIDFIVLAGFLALVPDYLINAFPDRIVNIHPALLPRYGGKGMYGANVHKTVIVNKEKESGISIHFVNEKYDEGKIILQAKCTIAENETPETLAAKIHQMEHEHYPKAIEKLIEQLKGSAAA